MQASENKFSWAEMCNRFSADKGWAQAISYLTENEKLNGISLQRFWSILNSVWERLKTQSKAHSEADFLQEYYQDPCWLLCGAYSESDNCTIEDRLAAVRLISSVEPCRILDYGGGAGTASRLCAKYLTSAKQIDLADIGPFAPTYMRHLENYPSIRLVSKPEPPYDAVICTEVLEHLIDPISAIIEINKLMRIGGAFAVSYSFSGDLYCHLKSNFHFKYTMHWIIRSLGFGFYGFERRGSTVYSFIKHSEINSRMLRFSNILCALSKLYFPFSRIFTFIKGL